MNSGRISAVILKNEIRDDHLLWVNACEKYDSQIEYRVVDLTQNNWFEMIHQKPFDVLLAKPVGANSLFKQLYDERIYILAKSLGCEVFPSLDEILIYENKRFLSYWLKANKIPHPRTDVFYDESEALSALSNLQLPLVAKTNIGGAGSGVVVLSGRQAAVDYLQKAFRGKGAHQRTGPNLSRGGLFKRGMAYLANPPKILDKIFLYRLRAKMPQRGFVIFQEFVKHNFEWRVVRIGDSFFAHKKMTVNGKASGALIKGYDDPPLELLDFVRQITDKYHFYSQAVDIFESDNGFMINEMQCIFGQSDPHQMIIGGKPGRYRFIKNEWVFEEGSFNTNKSFDLRVLYVIERFNQTKS